MNGICLYFARISKQLYQLLSAHNLHDERRLILLSKKIPRYLNIFTLSMILSENIIGMSNVSLEASQCNIQKR